jgi:hypothetical protein
MGNNSIPYLHAIKLGQEAFAKEVVSRSAFVNNRNRLRVSADIK